MDTKTGRRIAAAVSHIASRLLFGQLAPIACAILFRDLSFAEVSKMPEKPKRLEDLPPKLQEALKRKGWTYPPTEEMKRQWRDANKRMAGRVATDPALMRELYRAMGWTWLERKEKLSRRP
jgi:hypothetical protein